MPCPCSRNPLSVMRDDLTNINRRHIIAKIEYNIQFSSEAVDCGDALGLDVSSAYGF